MVDVDNSVVLTLFVVTVLAYGLASLVPRVDAMERSYRKFVSLTTLGLSYLVLLVLLLTIVVEIPESDPIGSVLAMAVAAFVLFGLSLLYDVFDDWIRMFGDPEYNTWVEASLVLAVLVFLVSIFLVGPQIN
ncbi:hypothetical protein OB955_20950 [Halobacteria archaeon AArc-m2/3/4]|uniref:Uncharacterized protein n=1 Tax=Natronoglomus mannanivorans TaxID=2979990 RepID=A0AAP2YYY5_9EURY|nr:hypothetical protein [Halobacteria archaeon AArc-xg1-1]MCU4975172.1 hypothetical protein [Halobacteria archaeon AArc-m2/3/4]